MMADKERKTRFIVEARTSGLDKADAQLQRFQAAQEKRKARQDALAKATGDLKNTKQDYAEITKEVTDLARVLDAAAASGGKLDVGNLAPTFAAALGEARKLKEVLDQQLVSVNRLKSSAQSSFAQFAKNVRDRERFERDYDQAMADRRQQEARDAARQRMANAPQSGFGAWSRQTEQNFKIAEQDARMADAKAAAQDRLNNKVQSGFATWSRYADSLGRVRDAQQAESSVVAAREAVQDRLNNKVQSGFAAWSRYVDNIEQARAAEVKHQQVTETKIAIQDRLNNKVQSGFRAWSEYVTALGRVRDAQTAVTASQIQAVAAFDRAADRQQRADDLKAQIRSRLAPRTYLNLPDPALPTGFQQFAKRTAEIDSVTQAVGRNTAALKAQEAALRAVALAEKATAVEAARLNNLERANDKVSIYEKQAGTESTASFNEGNKAQIEELAIQRAKEMVNARRILIQEYSAESVQVKRLERAMRALGVEMDGTLRKNSKLTNSISEELMAMEGYAGRGKLGLRPYEMVNLGYQVNDVVSGLAMGQAPMQVMAQQLGQIIQLFPRMVKAVATSIPLQGVLAFATVMIAAGARARETEQAIKAFSRELAVNADGANYNAEALGKMARAAADAGMEFAEAKEALSGFVKASVQQEDMAGLLDLAKNISKVTGGAVTKVASDLEGAFSGGFKGVREFDKQYRLLNATQLETIRGMYAIGDIAGAQDFIYASLTQNIAGSRTELSRMQQLGRAFTTTWNILLEAVANSTVFAIAAKGFDILAGSIQGVVELAGLAIDAMAGPNTLVEQRDALTGPLNEATAAYLTAAADYKTVADALATSPNDPVLGPLAANLKAELDEKLRLLNEYRTKMHAAQAAIVAQQQSTPGITDGTSEEEIKRLNDLSAALQLIETQRVASNVTKAQSARLTEEQRLRQEALSAAETAGVAITSNAAQMQIADFIAVGLAAYDQGVAQERLTDAVRYAEQATQEYGTEQEKLAPKIKEAESALIALVARFGATDPRARAAAAALQAFRDEASGAAAKARALTAAAVALSRAMASLGSIRVDLDSRLAIAQRKLDMAQAGYTEAQIEAEAQASESVSELTTVLRENGDVARQRGVTFDAVAQQHEMVRSRVEALTVTEEKYGKIIEERHKAEKDAAGGGETEMERREKALNLIVQQRASLLERIKLAKEQGDTELLGTLGTDLTAINTELLTGIDNMLVFLTATGGAEAEAAIEKMRLLKEQIADAADAAANSLFKAKEINEDLASIGADAFGALAGALARGENAAEAFFNTLRQGLANFLVKIAQAIAQQALLNALQGAVGGNGGAGGWLATALNSVVGVKHTGGMAGHSGVKRSVPTAIFAGAQRLHSGGMPGLKAGEVPTILKQNEEVLTRDDPRHVLNGGSNGAPTINKIVNVIDGADVMEHGLSTERGERAFFNFMSKNSRKIGGILG